jgi:hypothetical protein
MDLANNAPDGVLAGQPRSMSGQIKKSRARRSNANVTPWRRNSVWIADVPGIPRADRLSIKSYPGKCVSMALKLVRNDTGASKGGSVSETVLPPFFHRSNPPLGLFLLLLAMSFWLLSLGSSPS